MNENYNYGQGIPTGDVRDNTSGDVALLRDTFLNAERVAMRDYALIPVIHQGQRYLINMSVTDLISNFCGAPYSFRYMSMR